MKGHTMPEQGFIRTVVILTTAYASIAAGAGLDPADYQRALGVSDRFRSKVRNETLKPDWSADGNQFRYRAWRGPGTWQYITVDARTGTKQASSEPFDDANADVLPAYAPQSIPRGIRAGGETEITFVNRTDKEVELFWLSAGSRQSYGTLTSGQKRSQHTFAGHLWMVAEKNGPDIACYVADEAGGRAMIGAEAPRPWRPREAAGRGPRSDRPRRALSPDGHWRALIRDHNVYLSDPNSAAEIQLTTDGVADDAYTNEMAWSPDSKKLVVMRTIPAQEHKIHFIESSPSDQVEPKLHSRSYLKPGDRVAVSRPCLFDIASKESIPVSNELFSNPYALFDLRWQRDSTRFTFVCNQRGHQALRVIAVEAETGKANAIIDESSETFICYSSKYFCEHLDETREIIWMSERDGYNHLYLYDAQTGMVKNQITKGPWVVRSVDRVDTDKRQIWFRAGGMYPDQDPYYIHYARVSFDGTGLTILTDGDGTHSVQFSPDRRFMIDTWSRVNQPPVHELRDCSDGKLVCSLETADATELFKAGWQTPEPFSAKGRDGLTDIYGIIIRPTNFDPAQSYPIIENIYAGPHDSFVPKGFRAFYRMMELAELGFILVQIDGMGTSNRSKAFHDVCWKNLADAGLPDRVLWIKAAAQKYPYMDISRVGIYGGSAGGQNAAAAVMTHGHFYKAAVADCGCHDNRMDKIWWNEQWMGWPVGPEYAASSNVTLAPGLSGKLLLVVGEMDTNVDPASTMQVVNALVKADKDFEMLVIPGAGHGAGDSPYGARRRADFFVRHLQD
jgi:dipeptidyl aminopeptidase/acylaminoacyl peptidase